ncbi:MAG: DUF1810 domain-containing protein [Burkholderiaceae bacterium]|nr:DUF1810 domain-containing protein [Burkholderiaceae bacterium]
MAPAADDPFDLERFVDAQRRLCDWDGVLAELDAGRKRSHWMWFVFPQLRGLGHSAYAQRYGIEGLAEARAYARHPLLGPRLRDALQRLERLQGRSAEAVFGGIDAVKLRSCLTLFELADPAEPACARLLERWYAGRRDPQTLALLGLA